MSDELSIRDEIAYEIADVLTGEGCHSTTIGIYAAREAADYILASPVIRRIQAEALREYRVALSENPCADNWDKRGFIDDIEDWTQMLAHEAHYIEQEAGA